VNEEQYNKEMRKRESLS